MKRKRFSVELIIAVLKEHELGVPGTELCRRRGSRRTRFIAGNGFTAGSVLLVQAPCAQGIGRSVERLLTWMSRRSANATRGYAATMDDHRILRAQIGHTRRGGGVPEEQNQLIEINFRAPI